MATSVTSRNNGLSRISFLGYGCDCATRRGAAYWPRGLARRTPRDTKSAQASCERGASLRQTSRVKRPGGPNRRAPLRRPGVAGLGKAAPLPGSMPPKYWSGAKNSRANRFGQRIGQRRRVGPDATRSKHRGDRSAPASAAQMSLRWSVVAGPSTSGSRARDIYTRATSQPSNTSS